MAPSAQLLSDADMESSSSPWWSGGNSPRDFIPGWSTTEAVSGTHSLSLRDAAGRTGFFSFWAQTITVSDPSRMTLELSVAIKVAELQGEGVAIAIRGDDASLRNGDAEAWATTRGSTLVRGTQDWTTYSVQLGGLEAAIDQITVYLMYLPNSSGTVYFDDAVLSASTTN
jgi:hypothetical protein